MKLWEKGFETDKFTELFTIGNDQILDLNLAEYDVKGSIAHTQMLFKIGYITEEEYKKLIEGLNEIKDSIDKNIFKIEERVEDVHSQIEKILIEKLGDTGKRIHCGRSRNDQVATALRLFYRDCINSFIKQIDQIIEKLIAKSDLYKDIRLPGYTHLQAAMPSSFGLWFASYAESLVDDLHLLISLLKVTNQNPLGTAAGYGSSIPVDREFTTEFLGFENMIVNSAYAQMSRGKTDMFFSATIAAVSYSISKLCYDIIIYFSDNFKFISLPDDITSGSSIMPHKKNPDVFELIRAKCNRLITLPMQIISVYNNLPSGYHRDFQQSKDILFPAIKDMADILEMINYLLDKITPVDSILKDEKYTYIYSVDRVNELVLKGIPFRDAYKKVAEMINKEGEYQAFEHSKHSHIGSINNLCNDKILEKKNELLKNL